MDGSAAVAVSRMLRGSLLTLPAVVHGTSRNLNGDVDVTREQATDQERCRPLSESRQNQESCWK